MSGPSRPIDMPDAIATPEEATREPVVLSDNASWPSTTASITLLSPCRAAFLHRAMRPAANPPAVGTVSRNHHGRLAITLTTLSPPKAARYHQARLARNATANRAAPSATPTSAP